MRPGEAPFDPLTNPDEALRLAKAIRAAPERREGEGTGPDRVGDVRPGNTERAARTRRWTWAVLAVLAIAALIIAALLLL